jgi:hypothetical protein
VRTRKRVVADLAASCGFFLVDDADDAQYHLPRAKPPKAIRPIRAMMIPSTRLQKIATMIPTITMIPPVVIPPIPLLLRVVMFSP